LENGALITVTGDLLTLMDPAVDVNLAPFQRLLYRSIAFSEFFIFLESTMIPSGSKGGAERKRGITGHCRGIMAISTLTSEAQQLVLVIVFRLFKVLHQLQRFIVCTQKMKVLS
jgi:hypothetical protein